MKRRKHIPLKEKLAAALYEVAKSRMVCHEWRSAQISADDVISKFDFDHVEYHLYGRSDKWWNLTPMLRADHREKTKFDLATIAKGKRIQRKQAEHQARMEAKHADGPDPRSHRATQKRSFPNCQGATRNSHRATRRG